MKDEKREAHRLVNHSINHHGGLIRPSVCEICGCHTSQKKWFSLGYGSFPIMAHHWRGYDFPFDVWWVCVSCNALLRGRHDGLLKKSTFIRIMNDYLPLSRACLETKVTRQTLLTRVKRGKYPGAMQLSKLIQSDDSPYGDPWMIPKHLIGDTND